MSVREGNKVLGNGSEVPKVEECGPGLRRNVSNMMSREREKAWRLRKAGRRHKRRDS